MISSPRFAQMLWAFAIVLHLASWRSSADPALKSLVFHYASRSEAEQLLSVRDDFTTRLSPFDRAARMKVAIDPGQKAFLQFVRSNVVEWTPKERARLETLTADLTKKLSRFASWLPKRIVLIKTTGTEEGNAAYTRGNAIVLPPSRLALQDNALEPLLCHELFHILSRSNPRLRDQLYETIGFRRVPELTYPQSLRHRRITNPDAPVLEHAVQVQAQGKTLWAVPLLFSDPPTYDPARGGEFFSYLQFRLLVINPPTSSAARKKTSAVDPLQLVKIEETEGFYEQIGRNTGYIIHPEEILADHFAMLVLHHKTVVSPIMLEKMERVLLETAPTSKPK